MKIAWIAWADHASYMSGDPPMFFRSEPDPWYAHITQIVYVEVLP